MKHNSPPKKFSQKVTPTRERIENAYCNLKPDPVPPIMIGGTGEKYTLGVVAHYADWWNIDMHTNIDEFIHKLSVLERARKKGYFTPVGGKKSRRYRLSRDGLNLALRTLNSQP